MNATNVIPASKLAFHAPSRGVSRRPSTIAPTTIATEMNTKPKYNVVRWSMVDGWPTDGGLGGYFKNGTR